MTIDFKIILYFPFAIIKSKQIKSVSILFLTYVIFDKDYRGIKTFWPFTKAK